MLPGERRSELSPDLVREDVSATILKLAKERSDRAKVRKKCGSASGNWSLKIH